MVEERSGDLSGDVEPRHRPVGEVEDLNPTA
jgi:hypothetical protein